MAKMSKRPRKRKCSFPRIYDAAEKFLGNPASLPALNAIEWKTVLDLVDHPRLWKEAALLEVKCFNEENQYRGTDYFQRLREVMRYVRRLDSLHLAAMLSDLREMWEIGRWRNDVMLPCRECVAIAMRRIYAGCKVLVVLMDSCVKSGEGLIGTLALRHNTAHAVTWLALVARLRVLAGSMLTKLVQVYNKFADVLPILTPHPEKPNMKLLESLPFSLNHKFESDKAVLWPESPSSPWKSWGDRIEHLAKNAKKLTETSGGKSNGCGLEISSQDSATVKEGGGGSKVHPSFGGGLLMAAQPVPGVSQGVGGGRGQAGVVSLARMMRGNGHTVNQASTFEKRGVGRGFGGHDGVLTKRKATGCGGRQHSKSMRMNGDGSCGGIRRTGRWVGDGGGATSTKGQKSGLNSDCVDGKNIKQRCPEGGTTTATNNFHPPFNHSAQQLQKSAPAFRNGFSTEEKWLLPKSSGKSENGNGMAIKRRTLEKKKKGQSGLPGWGSGGKTASGDVKSWDQWFN